MNRLNIKRFALAWGLTGALLYAGHVILVLTIGSQTTLKFLYNALYGLDVSKITEMDTLLLEVSLGMAETFIQGGVTGACIALIYNISLSGKKKAQP